MAELTKEQIIENNKIIAQFMGAVPHIETERDGSEIEIWSYDTFPTQHSCMNWDARHMQYISDWNWIMPVVEKIEEEMGGFINIRGGRISIAWIDFSDEEDNPLTIEGAYDKTVKFEKQTGEDTKLLKLYSLIVEFIVWYNKNKINYD